MLPLEMGVFIEMPSKDKTAHPVRVKEAISSPGRRPWGRVEEG